MKHRINVTFEDDTFKQIENIANSTHTTLSEVVRNFAIQGINGEVGAKNIDLITSIIREQLRVILKPDTDRICSLLAKGTIMSATSAYLNAEAISRFVDINLQSDVQSVYDQAHKKAVLYTKSKINLDDNEF